MKKRLRMSILLGYALAAHGAHAETGLNLLWQDKEIRTSALSRASSPNVRSHIALIFDEQSQLPLYNKNSRTVAPIASITKLMTALVVLDAKDLSLTKIIPVRRHMSRQNGSSDCSSPSTQPPPWK